MAVGSTYYFFRNSNVKLYRYAHQQMIEQPNSFVNSMDEGVQRVLNGGYALFGESTYITSMLSRHCDLVKVGGNLDSKGYGFATPIGSELRNHVSLALMELAETHTLSALQQKWWTARNTCPAGLPQYVSAGSLSGAVHEGKDAPDFDMTRASTLVGPLVLLVIGLLAAAVLTMVALVSTGNQGRADANKQTDQTDETEPSLATKNWKESEGEGDKIEAV